MYKDPTFLRQQIKIEANIEKTKLSKKKETEMME
jgi:hypothetical protein